MAGNHEEITEEIGALIKEDNLNNDAALRLILANQLVINRRMKETKECVGEVKKDVSEIKTALERYPSVTWLWIHKRKSFILMIISLMVLYTILFSPINFSDLRMVLLDWAGLPTDLGLVAPTLPTPIP